MGQLVNSPTLFTFGFNVVKCEFDEDLFYHYMELEDGTYISDDWIQLMVANIDNETAAYYVQDGMLVFFNTRTHEYLATNHTLVERAEDVEFILVPHQTQEALLLEFDH